MLKQPLDTALFTGHRNGQYTLPDELVRARDTYAGVREAVRTGPTPPQPAAEVLDLLVDQALEAVANGKPMPDASSVLEAERAEENYARTLTLYGDADERAMRRLNGAVHEYALQTITDHLQPAHAEVLDQLRDGFAKTASISSDHEALRAPTKVRDAWLETDKLVARYSAIHQARDTFARVGVRPERDEQGFFAVLKNVDTLWPQYAQPSQFGDSRPWAGLDLRGRLRYWLLNGGEPWLPTPREQDARYWDVLGPAIERTRSNAHQVRAMAAIFE